MNHTLYGVLMPDLGPDWQFIYKQELDYDILGLKYYAPNGQTYGTSHYIYHTLNMYDEQFKVFILGAIEQMKKSILDKIDCEWAKGKWGIEEAYCWKADYAYVDPGQKKVLNCQSDLDKLDYLLEAK